MEEICIICHTKFYMRDNLDSRITKCPNCSQEYVYRYPYRYPTFSDKQIEILQNNRNEWYEG